MIEVPNSLVVRTTSPNEFRNPSLQFFGGGLCSPVPVDAQGAFIACNDCVLLTSTASCVEHAFRLPVVFWQ